MKSLVLILGALLAIAAVTPAAAAAAEPAPLQPPHCSSDRQCAGMWSAARNWVTDHCGMKIETMTDSYIETYNSVDGRSYCRVWRDPDPEGGFVFHARVAYGAPFMSKQNRQLAEGLQAALNAAADAFK